MREIAQHWGFFLLDFDVAFTNAPLILPLFSVLSNFLNGTLFARRIGMRATHVSVNPNRLTGLKVQETCLDCRLRAGGFFCELRPNSLGRFESLKVTKMYPKGTRLFVEGQPSEGVYLLCQGRVKLSTCSPDGKIIITDIIEPGELLGLSAVVGEVEYEATAEVLDTCQANFLRKDDLVSFLRQNSSASFNAIRQLGRNYREAHRMICALGLADSASVRLAKLFLKWSKSECEQTGPLHLTNPFTHEEIAGMIGATRETVTRTLRDLRERGLVTLKGRSLKIHDPQRLRESIGFRNLAANESIPSNGAVSNGGGHR